jgi:hypothetical protein
MTHRPTTQQPTANQIPAISGSLRRDSYNTAAPPGRGGHVRAALDSAFDALGSQVRYRSVPLSRTEPAREQLLGRGRAAALRDLLAELIVPLQDESRHGE